MDAQALYARMHRLLSGRIDGAGGAFGAIAFEKKLSFYCCGIFAAEIEALEGGLWFYPAKGLEGFYPDDFEKSRKDFPKGFSLDAHDLEEFADGMAESFRELSEIWLDGASETRVHPFFQADSILRFDSFSGLRRPRAAQTEAAPEEDTADAPCREELDEDM